MVLVLVKTFHSLPPLLKVEAALLSTKHLPCCTAGTKHARVQRGAFALTTAKPLSQTQMQSEGVHLQIFLLLATNHSSGRSQKVKKKKKKNTSRQTHSLVVTHRHSQKCPISRVAASPSVCPLRWNSVHPLTANTAFLTNQRMVESVGCRSQLCEWCMRGVKDIRWHKAPISIPLSLANKQPRQHLSLDRLFWFGSGVGGRR